MRAAPAFIAALLALARPSAAQSGPARPSRPLQQAYMVIADGARTREQGEILLAAYEARGSPRHDAYPRLMLSTQVQGAKPGFWIVVAAICRDREVANLLSTFLRKQNSAAHVREVQVEAPENLRLAVIERSEVLYEDEGAGGAGPKGGRRKKTVARSWSVNQRCPLNQEGCGYVIPPRGLAAAGPSGAAVIPYTVDPTQGSQAYLEADIPEPFLQENDVADGRCDDAVPGTVGGYWETQAHRVLRVARAVTRCHEYGD
jgi:hypothetical protein